MTSHLARNLRGRIMDGDYAILTTHKFIRDCTPPGISVVTVFPSKLAGVKDTSFMKTQHDPKLF